MPTTTRTPAFCTQCRSRCGCVAVVEDGRLTGIEPLPGHPPPATSSVPRGRSATEHALSVAFISALGAPSKDVGTGLCGGLVITSAAHIAATAIAVTIAMLLTVRMKHLLPFPQFISAC